MQNIKELVLNIKKRLKDDLIIAAHHYQNQNIIDVADYVGDSYMLAKEVTKISKKNIILCGVKFMAQTVKILAREDQHVYMPEVNALCPLAEMVKLEDLEYVYNYLKNTRNLDIVIVTYVNSYVDIKAFTGKTYGSCCTSSNAGKIIKYFLNQNKKIIFVPDFYLGSNSSIKIGNLNVKSLFENNRLLLDNKENYQNIDIFLWNGFCPVHQVYKEEDIINFRKNYPGIKVVVHPESKIDVVK
ncbi:MAG: quinolinate synthase NadA, partial [Exilispira sp.]